MNAHPNVDSYFSKLTHWQEVLEKLRNILLDAQLTEELKWRKPCYTFQNSNIVILGGFKEYCALSFFKGSLLKDPSNLLVAPGENSQSVRMIKFTSVAQIDQITPILKKYLNEAIAVEKAGLKVVLKDNTKLRFSEEFQRKLNQYPLLKTAFDGLTPGRQRAYNLHFSAAKQAKTREARIEKYIPKILEGIGINDCTCGLSKKQPYCDGSHRDADTKNKVTLS